MKLWIRFLFADAKERKLIGKQWRVNRARKIADLKHSIDGKRYYVLEDPSGRLHILSRKDILKYKKAGAINKGAGFDEIISRALYFTNQ